MGITTIPRTNDGRKYEVGDEVEFTDDNGKKVPGVVHAVRYQVGRYELVGAHHENMFDKTTPIVPGTGHMELVKGTEEEHHDFQYIMVHKDQHEAWWKTEKANQKHIGAGNHHLVSDHPELVQHVRIYEEDEVDKPQTEG